MTLVLVVNCRPTRLEGYMMEKGSGTLPTLDHLENYQEIFEKWLNFGSPLR